MKALPAHVDDLSRRRAARWVRESTAGQYDAFGPDSQREQQDRAIAQFGLMPTPASSGRSPRRAGRRSGPRPPSRRCSVALARTSTSSSSPTSRASCATSSRRSIFRDEMHERGAAVYVCDERILSSDERAWDEWVREAHDAEAFSRKLSRRVGEGYAAKRRRLGVPGGNRPPLGYRRVRVDAGEPPVTSATPHRPGYRAGRSAGLRAVRIRVDRP